MATPAIPERIKAGIWASAFCFTISGENQSGNLGFGLLLYHQVAEQVGVMRRPRAGYQEPQEYVACQGYQSVVSIEAGDKRGATEQHNVQACPHQRTKPKDRVIIFVLHLPAVGQRSGEPAFLQGARHGGEDGQHPYHAIVGIIQQTGQDDAEKQIE